MREMTNQGTSSNAGHEGNANLLQFLDGGSRRSQEGAEVATYWEKKTLPQRAPPPKGDPRDNNGGCPGLVGRKRGGGQSSEGGSVH